ATGCRSSANDAVNARAFYCHHIALNLGNDLVAASTYLRLRSSYHAEHWDSLLIGAEIVDQSCFKCGIAELVNAKCTVERILSDALDQLSTANKGAALRTTQQLLAAGSHHIAAGSYTRRQLRLTVNAVWFERFYEPSSLIFEYCDFAAFS